MKLREIRKLRGLSQEKLAELAGTTQVTISLLETGKVAANSRTRKRLQKALGTKINWLDGKGTARFKGQDFNQLEERFRKVLYDVNFLPEKDKTDFLSIAKTYLSNIEKGLTA
jgi:transcriptional regulator with XRE-family HTH domain